MTSIDANGSSLMFSGLTMDMISFSGPNFTRGTIESTTLTTSTARTFIPEDLYDAGEFSCTVEFDNTDDGSSLIAGASGTLTISFPGTNGSYAASAHCTGFSITGPESGNRLTAEASFKLSGELTYTGPT